MLFGQLALVLAAAFAGAAFYINFAEHPARLGLDDKSSLKQWKPSYDAGYTMQATLVGASGILGLLAAWTSQNWHWIVGAVLILSNVPYTLMGIMPTNHKLEAISEADAGPSSRATLVLWGKLHAIRTLLGVSATLAFGGKADMTRTRSNVVAELMKGTANWNTWRRAFNFGCGASGR